jgi:hypothetical protein
MAVMRAGPASHPISPGRFLVLISVRRGVDCRTIVRLEGLGTLKKIVTLSEIESATTRLVGFFLNQLHYIGW